MCVLNIPIQRIFNKNIEKSKNNIIIIFDLYDMVDLLAINMETTNDRQVVRHRERVH